MEAMDSRAAAGLISAQDLCDVLAKVVGELDQSTVRKRALDDIIKRTEVRSEFATIVPFAHVPMCPSSRRNGRAFW